MKKSSDTQQIKNEQSFILQGVARFNCQTQDIYHTIFFLFLQEKKKKRMF